MNIQADRLTASGISVHLHETDSVEVREDSMGHLIRISSDEGHVTIFTHPSSFAKLKEAINNA